MQMLAPASHVQLPAALITCHCGLQSPAKALKSKYTLGGVHYRSLDVKTELLSPEASLYQQLEFHRAAEEREAQETGAGLEVRGVHKATRPLWRSEECSTLLKRLFDVQRRFFFFPTFWDKYMILRTKTFTRWAQSFLKYTTTHIMTFYIHI